MGRQLGDVLNDIGMGTYQFVQLLLLGGIMMSDGAEILVSSSVLQALKTTWHLTPMVRGAMMSTVFVGVFTGGLIGGQMGDVYGRLRPTIISYVGIITFGTGTALAQGPISMLCFRFMFGTALGCGMGPGLALQVETAPSSWRAHVINLGGIWISLGEIYTAVLLILFMPDLVDPTGTHWRWVTVLSLVPGVLLFPFCCMLLQESPRYLLVEGRRTEAIAALQYIGHMNNAADKVEDLDGPDEDRQLQMAPSAQASASLSPASGSLLASAAPKSARRPSISSSSSQTPQQRAQERAAIIQEEHQNLKRTTVKESLEILFSKEYRPIVIGGAYVCFLANFLFYGLTYSLPQIFASLSKEIEPAFQVLIISICDMPGVLLSFFLIYAKGIGHRTGLVMLASSAAVLNLTLISIDHGSNGLYLGLPSAYLAKYVASAFFTLAYVYLSEVFPSKVRSSGVSLCIAAGRFGSMSAPLIVESLHHQGFKLGEHAPFLILTSALCLIGIVMIKFMLYFELKNAPLDEGTSAGAPAVSKDGGDERIPRAPLDPDMPAPAG